MKPGSGDEAGFAEGVVGIAAWGGPADDEVVDEADLQEVGGLDHAAGGGFVGAGWGRIAGGVVVLCVASDYV